jgi:hypothetical protein
VRAKYSVDGMWYEATVETVSEAGYLVNFKGYGNK